MSFLKKNWWWILLIVIASLGILIVTLPEKIPIHYDFPSSYTITNSTEYKIDTLVFIAAHEIFKIDTLTVHIQYYKKYFISNPGVKAVLYQVNKNTYNLFLDSSISSRDIESIIAHEMIHLKQFDSSILKQTSKDTMTYSNYSFSTSTPYSGRPWERDAYANQDLMLSKIKSLMYEKKN